LAVVAQTLYGAVNERLKEFATLKALGADDRCIARFLLAQALGNALIGSALGIALSVAVALSPLSTPRAPMVLTWQIAVTCVVLVTWVCLLAARLPLRRVRCIDPACVLRG
jgi:putative ABC transport system permease protein